jgi:formate hydrogenlyase subunit 6/NADH:ubiquinone oxidoreductase subunit I
VFSAVAPTASRPDHTARAAREAAEARARASFPARPFIARAIARLDASAIGDEEWQALGPACFACTGCTSLCPTCSCFTIVDEPHARGGERVRHWDSCLLEGFQREGSGHHPSPRAGDRVRRFWQHKLANEFVADRGRIGCVGCGRCDVACPGSIGALRVLEALGGR